MLWNIILYGLLMLATVTVFFTCVLVCIKLCRPEIEIIVEEEEDDLEFFAVPRRLLPDVAPSFETAHITRDSLRYDSSDDHSYVLMDLYKLSSSASLTSSGKGNTTDDQTDSNPVEYGKGNTTDDQTDSNPVEYGKGNTTDNHTDSNPVEDAVKTDENDDASGSVDDSVIKSNAEDHNPTNPERKSGDN